MINHHAYQPSGISTIINNFSHESRLVPARLPPPAAHNGWVRTARARACRCQWPRPNPAAQHVARPPPMLVGTAARGEISIRHHCHRPTTVLNVAHMLLAHETTTKPYLAYYHCGNAIFRHSGLIIRCSLPECR